MTDKISSKDFIKAFGGGAVEPRIEYGTDGQPYKLSMTSGKEYERPQGDLISREALRRNMEFICMGIMAGTEPYNAPLTEIDNAPSIPLPEFKAGYKQAIIDGKTNYSRPQGEWVMDKKHTKNPLLWYKCNLCGVYHSPTNFCPNCGADMRKGNVE